MMKIIQLSISYYLCNGTVSVALHYKFFVLISTTVCGQKMKERSPQGNSKLQEHIKKRIPLQITNILYLDEKS
jgi:hypothetical protein